MENRTSNRWLFISYFVFAFCLVSIVTELGLFDLYFKIRPKQPNPEAGFVCPLNNHGSYAYLSNIECTELRLLFFSYILAFITLLLVNLKFRSDNAFKQNTKRRYLLMIFAISFWSIIFICMGPTFVRFAMSQGVIFKSAN